MYQNKTPLHFWLTATPRHPSKFQVISVSMGEDSSNP